MAKCVIEIEDAPGGKVRITATPSFKTVCEMVNSGHNLTSAHTYFMHGLRKLMEFEKNLDPKENKIFVPRISR